MSAGNSKIPKLPSLLKPPTRSHKNLSVAENKTSTVKTTENAAVNVAARRGLRRSKSTPHLNPLASRPLLTNVRPGSSKQTEKNNALLVRTGQKRPATQKTDQENKPKIQKVKIPDWDYKSRFHEIQKKHTTLVGSFNEMKTRILNFEGLDEEVQILRQENSNQKEQLQAFGHREELWRQEKERLSGENSDLSTQLLKLTNDFNDLEKRHELLQENHKENLEVLEKIRSENSTLTSQLEKINIDYNELRTEHELLKKNYKENLDRLDTLQDNINEAQSQNIELSRQNEELIRTNLILKEDLEAQYDHRRQLHNAIQDLKGNIRVFCRVRPPTNTEIEKNELCAIHFPNESSLDIRKSRESINAISGRAMDFKQEFSFDRVFPPEANQAEVFEELSQLVQSALDGYNVCVFAYGQTGSGKTYTMQGTTTNHGMIPRTIDLIFEKIEKLKIAEWNYTVSASFLEIYNENIKDLLVPHSAYDYELRYNEGRGVTVTNLKIVPIDSAHMLKSLMEEAHKNRAVANTDFNEHSSRSHAVTKIHLEGYNALSRAKYAASINLVDLAGSESAKTSSAERLNETKSINKSLSTLGNVMLALHNKDAHVPFRDSKLTFLLQSCLGGNSKTLMIVNISPFEECFGESVNSLRFAAKVKEIKTSAKKNKCYAPPAALLPIKKDK